MIILNNEFFVHLVAQRSGQQDDRETDSGPVKNRVPDFFWRPMRSDKHFLVKPNRFFIEPKKDLSISVNRFLEQIIHAKNADFFLRRMFT